MFFLTNYTLDLIFALSVGLFCLEAVKHVYGKIRNKSK